MADLERLDAGALLLLGLEAGEPGVAVAGKLAEFVEFGAVAVADDAALADGDGRGVGEGVEQEAGEVGEGIEAGGLVADKLRIGGGEGARDIGDGLERGGEGAEVAPVALAGANARDEAFEVADGAERFAEGAEGEAVRREPLDGVEARVDFRETSGGALELMVEDPGIGTPDATDYVASYRLLR